MTPDEEWEKFLQKLLVETTLPQIQEIVPKFKEIEEQNKAREAQEKNNDFIYSIMNNIPMNPIEETNENGDKVFKLEAHKNDYAQNAPANPRPQIQTPMQQTKHEINTVEEKPKSFIDKYKGLSPLPAAQKAFSKSPNLPTEFQYYGLSSKLSDNEKPSEKMAQQNTFYKVKDIKNPELQQDYFRRAAHMYNLDPNDPSSQEKILNTNVVIPKVDSDLYQNIKESDTTQKWVANNYDNNNLENASIEYPLDGEILNDSKRALFGTIHRADMSKSHQNPDGSYTAIPTDEYDYNEWQLQKYEKDDFKTPKKAFKKLIYNQVARANNRAHKQQEASQLENYILSAPVWYSEEELEKMRRKHLH